MPVFQHLIKYSYILLLYPVLILSAVISSHTGKSFMPERIIFLHLLLYFLVYFIASNKWKVLYIWFVYILTLIPAIFEAAYVTIYKERVTTSTAFILLETNASETKEYLNEYFTWDIFWLLLTFLIPSVFILIGAKKAVYRYSLKSSFQAIFNDLKTCDDYLNLAWENTQQGKWRKWGFGVFLLAIGIIIYLNSNHHKYHAFYKLYSGYEKYQEDVEKYKVLFSDSQNSEYLKSVKEKRSAKKETLIITIGESTTKHHLGLYGYSRNTTPNLEKISDELVVFKNVISPHTHTIPSLEKVLTFGSTNNPKAKKQGSIFQLLKAAGYKTFWISNQIPVGINETMVTQLAKAADYTYFTNLGTEKSIYPLDERVLPIVERVLKDQSQMKVIFIQLMGTHSQYENRYPSNFNKFTDIPKTQFPSEKAHEVINHYDNAVLYNDFIVHSLISLLKKSAEVEEKQHFIYLSDHGEDVFQTVDFRGHSESIGSYPMYEIPFIYWSNQKDRLVDYRDYTDRKYITDDFIHSIADLLTIRFKGESEEKSIFSPHFIPKKRIVMNTKDFDTDVKKQN